MQANEAQANGAGANQVPQNPYVGPRPFEEADRGRYFGREREARDLLALVIRERLVLFFAQSGAGKSSLLRAQLIPDLRGQDFDVLPIGRVSGALPEGVDPESVDNIFVYQLLLSLNAKLPEDQQTAPESLVGVTLLEFLGGQDVEALDTGQELAPTVLVIDQFEEIFTSYAGRWDDRSAFFDQLNDALEKLQQLWVVLSLREDYLAPLEPHAERMANRLRARFYMERMGYDAALKAVSEPAALFGRPFESGVAEKLVDDLRQVHVLGQQDTVSDQYVQPVQLQVVCLRLWERLPPAGTDGSALKITAADLKAAGDVNQALMGFYEDKLQEVLADPDVARAGVTERSLRTWFQRELITETGIRNLVLRDDTEGVTGSLPNVVVDHLSAVYLLRSEGRSGGTWVELAHDRLVDPIRESNGAWFMKNQSALERQAATWRDAGKPPDRLLLAGDDLMEAERWAVAHERELEPYEKELLAASKAARDAAERELEAEREAARRRELEAAQALAEEQRQRADEQTMAADRLRRQSRRTRNVAAVAVTAAVLASIGLAMATAGVRFGVSGQQAAAAAEIRAADEATRAATEARAADTARESAETAQATALSAQLAARAAEQGAMGSLDLGLLLGAEALRRADTPVARQAMEGLLLVEPGVQSYLYGHDAPVGSLAFSPEAQRLASGDDAGVLIIWSALEPDRALADRFDTTYFETGFGSIQAVALNADASMWAAGSGDGRIRLWEEGQLPPRRLDEHDDLITGLAFSPDGRFLASTSFDGRTILWDPAQSARFVTLEEGAGPATAVAFSPDPAGPLRLATGGDDGQVTIWTDLEAKQPVKDELPIREVISGTVSSLAFDSDGARLALGFDDGRFTVWDPARRGLAFDPVDASDSSVESLAFDAAHDALTVLFGDGSLKRYTLADLAPPIQDLASSTQPVLGTRSATLTPGGSAWSLGLDTGAIMLARADGPPPLNASADPEALIAQACRIANRNLYESEWQVFVGEGLPYRKTCPEIE